MSLTMRWSEAGYLSRIVLAHTPRQASVSLILGVGQMMKHSNIIDQARAKLIWGESVDAVREFLLSNGVSHTEAEQKIEEFSAERNLDIRKIGIKKIVIGGALTFISVFFFFSVYQSGHMDTNYRSAKGAAVIVLVGFYGIWKLIDGIVYLARPQSETKCIREISE